jgi:hypothetical protein
MSQVQTTITNLPQAGPIQGTEAVPIVQNGVTKQTTTAAIAAAPSQFQTFLTINQESTLPNSRYLSTGTGLGLADGGAQSYYRITLNGASGSLEAVGQGIVVKDSGNSVINRSIAVTGNGLAITNGNGVAGNPTIALDGLSASLAGMSGSGLVAVLSGTTVTPRSLLGVADQTSVTNGNGLAGSPTIGLADNAILPGTGAVTIPIGTTLQQPAGSDGQLRYDSTASAFYGYSAGSWRQFSLSGGVTLINTGTGLLGGPITSTGTISIDTTVVATLTGSQTLTNKTISGFNNTLTNIGNGSLVNSSITIGSDTVSLGGSISTFSGVSISGTSNTLSNIGNASLTNSAITINGSSVSLGGSITVTATASNALTIGTGLTGGSYDGSAPVTIAIDSSVVTLTGSQTLTNKSISGATNTLSAISNASLDNSSVTYNGVTVALGAGGTITAVNPYNLTIGTGLTGGSYDGSGAVTVAIDSTVATLSGSQTLTNKSISGSTNTLTNIPNSALTNSSVTIGSTNVALGGTVTTLAGLTSITLTQDPVSDLQVATKQYVDSIASGLNYHQPVNYASTAALPAYTYNNGASGVGATITANANGALSFGGGSPTATQRLLVKDEVGGNQAYNGIYVVTQAGSGGSPFILTRATDYDTSGAGTNEIDAGDYVLVISGTNASTAWVQQTTLPIVVGTTALVFLQFNAPITYNAGTGLNLSPATTFNISNTGVTATSYGSASSVATFTVNAQGQLTTAATTSISINGNQITSGTVGSAYISGSYTGITGVGTLTAGTWNATTIDAGYGGTGLASYTAGDLIYATGTTTLAKLAIGSSSYVLTSTGAAPQYVAQSTLSVGSATTATTATNVAGGAAGSLVYQTGSGATSTLALGTSGYVLTAGASAPTYVAQSTLSVGSATNASNVAVTASSTNSSFYPTFVSATTGNLAIAVDSDLTYNPSTNTLTAGTVTATTGIFGGTF